MACTANALLFASFGEVFSETWALHRKKQLQTLKLAFADRAQSTSQRCLSCSFIFKFTVSSKFVGRARACFTWNLSNLYMAKSSDSNCCFSDPDRLLLV